MTNKTRGWMAVAVVAAVWMTGQGLVIAFGVSQGVWLPISFLIGFTGGFYIFENFNSKQ